MTAPSASVLIPAYNEERTIGRLLTALTDGSAPDLEIVVVCNGCQDRTADVARAYDVTVLELAEGSKQAALRLGNEVARAYPRLYLDADVQVGAADVARLVEAVGVGRKLAAGPRRRLPRDGVQPVVRWYYDVWEELPQVRSGLFGRGVIAMSQAGSDRVRALPPTMADDLAIAEAFAPAERIVVSDAFVVVHPPKSVRDLVRRRSRVATGNVEADRTELRGADARTGLGTLAALLVRRPSLALRMPAFLGVTVAARWHSRRAVHAGDFTTWERDESSRA